MFTNLVPKPKISESFSDVPKPKVSETYVLVGKPKVSEAWVMVKLETAPASNISDIAEADATIVDDSNAIPNLSE